VWCTALNKKFNYPGGRGWFNGAESSARLILRPLALGFNWFEACTASIKCNAWKKFNILIKVKNHKKFTYDYYSLLKLNGPKGPVNPALSIKAELCSLGELAEGLRGNRISICTHARANLLLGSACKPSPRSPLP
jgi:hypothetical protein